jgi:hypothetical protein
MFIVDAGHNVFGTKELGILINKALNRIDGFEKLIFNGDFDIVKASDGYTFGQGFLKFRDKKSTIYAIQLQNLYVLNQHLLFTNNH